MTDAVKKLTCSDCPYWDGNTVKPVTRTGGQIIGYLAECRASAPKAERGYAIWPKVADTDWCGVVRPLRPEPVTT
jgi:hypothetical protein